MEQQRKRISLLRKLVVALVITITFTVLSVFPNIGYFAEVHTAVLASDVYGFLTIRAYSNMTYNPFLYSFSWMSGNGHYSGSFLFISKPQYRLFGEGARVVHRVPKDLEEEAVLTAVVRQLFTSIPFNFITLLLIAVADMQDLYICISTGIFAFPLLGVLGAFLGFFSALLLVMFNTRGLKKERSILIGIWDLLVEKYIPE